MRFYTGSYTRMGGPGIGVCRWENGALSLLRAYHDLNDTTYAILSADHRTLYTAGSLPETGEGAVVSYRVAGDTLSLLSCRETAGKAACHQAESPDGRYLYVASYLSGSVAVFPVRDGVLGERIQLVEHTGHGPNPDRQEAAHTHQCVFRPRHERAFRVRSGDGSRDDLPAGHRKRPFVPAGGNRHAGRHGPAPSGLCTRRSVLCDGRAGQHGSPG